MAEPSVIHTPRLVLRPLAEGDIDAVYEACQDEEIQRWTTVPVPFLRSHAETLIRETWPAGWANGTLRARGSFTRDAGELVSVVGIFGGDNATFEIGYWTAKEQRGRGYTVEAVAAAARWAFTELGAERLEWQGMTGNTASWAVAEKVGFQHEGTFRSRFVHRGVRRGSAMGGLLPGDLGIEPGSGWTDPS